MELSCCDIASRVQYHRKLSETENKADQCLEIVSRHQFRLWSWKCLIAVQMPRTPRWKASRQWLWIKGDVEELKKENIGKAHQIVVLLKQYPEKM